MRALYVRGAARTPDTRRPKRQRRSRTTQQEGQRRPELEGTDHVVSQGYQAWTDAGVAVSGKFLYLDQENVAYVSTKAGAVRFSTPVDLRRQLEGWRAAR